MADNDILIGYVLDQSGSMRGLRTPTIKGFNAFVKDQASQDGTAWLSLTLFDSDRLGMGRFDVRYVAWDTKDIPEMGLVGDNAYQPEGGTPLYDAVGLTIEGVTAWLRNNSWFDGKVLIVIWTDGQENSSKEWTLDRLNARITEKQNDGWEFLFQGAGSAAWLEARKFVSIAQDHTMVFGANEGALLDSYVGSSASVRSLRSTGTLSTTAWQQSYNATDQQAAQFTETGQSTTKSKTASDSALNRLSESKTSR